MRMDIAVFDGVDEMDALGPLEVLRAAARAGADIDVRLVTHEQQDVLTGLNGLRFLSDDVYRPALTFSWSPVVAGAAGARQGPGARYSAATGCRS